MDSETYSLNGSPRRAPTATWYAPARLLSLLALVLVLAIAACAPTPPPDDDDDDDDPPPAVGDVRLKEVVSGVDYPVVITNAGDERLFVVERAGRIWIVQGGAVQPEPFLDIRSDVATEGEQGMLGLAFPPDYATSGAFYVYFTNTDGRGALARFHVSDADPDSAEVNGETLIELTERSTNHNGGQIAFGPDGYLYWAVGDAGNSALAQDLGSRRGKLLRIDVSGATGYTAPADNPFASEPGAAPEVWAYGLRNPWRFSFDHTADLIYIADVGENRHEEVNVQPSTAAGLNYGWPVMEGDACFQPADCDPSGYTPPTFTYDHDTSSRSITGGYVYRGPSAPDLVGHYVFGDYMTSRLYTAAASDQWRMRPLLENDERLRTATFGEGADGQLYVANFENGTIYEITQELP